ncbi:fat-like cadherin-related tumor suppressor homolog isoform X2 [Ixodes scapularis]
MGATLPVASLSEQRRVPNATRVRRVCGARRQAAQVVPCAGRSAVSAHIVRDSTSSVPAAQPGSATGTTAKVVDPVPAQCEDSPPSEMDLDVAAGYEQLLQISEDDEEGPAQGASPHRYERRPNQYLPSHCLSNDQSPADDLLEDGVVSYGFPSQGGRGFLVEGAPSSSHLSCSDLSVNNVCDMEDSDQEDDDTDNTVVQKPPPSTTTTVVCRLTLHGSNSPTMRRRPHGGYRPIVQCSFRPKEPSTAAHDSIEAAASPCGSDPMEATASSFRPKEPSTAAHDSMEAAAPPCGADPMEATAPSCSAASSFRPKGPSTAAHDSMEAAAPPCGADRMEATAPSCSAASSFRPKGPSTAAHDSMEAAASTCGADPMEATAPSCSAASSFRPKEPSTAAHDSMEAAASPCGADPMEATAPSCSAASSFRPKEPSTAAHGKEGLVLETTAASNRQALPDSMEVTAPPCGADPMEATAPSCSAASSFRPKGPSTAAHGEEGLVPHGGYSPIVQCSLQLPAQRLESEGHCMSSLQIPEQRLRTLNRCSCLNVRRRPHGGYSPIVQCSLQLPAQRTPQPLPMVRKDLCWKQQPASNRQALPDSMEVTAPPCGADPMEATAPSCSAASSFRPKEPSTAAHDSMEVTAPPCGADPMEATAPSCSAASSFRPEEPSTAVHDSMEAADSPCSADPIEAIVQFAAGAPTGDTVHILL